MMPDIRKSLNSQDNCKKEKEAQVHVFTLEVHFTLDCLHQHLIGIDHVQLINTFSQFAHNT